MKIGTASAGPGEKSHGFLKVTTGPDGSDVGIPVIIVNGSQEGPVLLVDGAHHGPEYEGTEAILRVASELDPNKLKGTFIGVPVMNTEAFKARDRISHIDYQDMNRVYPGNEHGTATEQIVFKYLNEVVPKADYLITCHGGGDHFSPLTYVHAPAWNESEACKKSIELAKIFGMELIRTATKPVFSGYLPQFSIEKGIPTILPESGGLTDTYEYRGHYVGLLERGFKNVMKHLGMIEGKPELPLEQFVVDITFIHPKHGGLWIPEVKGSPEKPGAPKAMVKKGTVLGRVVNPFNIDEELERLVAPYDGMVVGIYYHPIVYPGEHVIYYADVKKI